MNTIHPVITELLRQRGILTPEEIEEFLSPKPQKMYDPFLLYGMREGVDLIVYAVKNNKRICIYGDYDADGITATTLMMDALSTVTDNIFYYIPSRFEEGYGLNKEAIDTIFREGCEVIITVDCGSVSWQEVAYAKSLGMKILVTDHHITGDMLADCIVINPKQDMCDYPFNELAGCGVAFKVVQALVQEGLIERDVLVKSMDLVAIGTIGDVVPLVDENRTFAKYGIRSINLGLRPGLKELLKRILPKQQTYNSDNISFAIVPHLNACGRMEDASVAVELLRMGERDFSTIAEKIIANNERRKETQARAYEECKAIVEAQHTDDSFLVIRADDVHEGIAGIVAGKVKECYNKPTIILTRSKGSFKGTGRSVDGLNLYLLLSKIDYFFERFGGHAGACGFTLKSEEEINLFRQKLIEEMREVEIEDASEVIKSDLALSINQINIDLAKALESLAPFGHKNPKPAFYFKNVRIGNIRYMGENSQHARFDALSSDGSVTCVLFNKAQDYIDVLNKEKIDMLASVELQYWNGRGRTQLIIEEMR